jgi:hypothetical protein
LTIIKETENDHNNDNELKRHGQERFSRNAGWLAGRRLVGARATKRDEKQDDGDDDNDEDAIPSSVLINYIAR